MGNLVESTTEFVETHLGTVSDEVLAWPVGRAIGKLSSFATGRLPDTALGLAVSANDKKTTETARQQERGVLPSTLSKCHGDPTTVPADNTSLPCAMGSRQEQ